MAFQLLSVLKEFFLSAVALEAADISLPYITLSGSYSNTYNITYYRRIPFGASTAGLNRFNAPQPPPHVNGVYDTDQAFPSCPLGDGSGSEDCLYLGVYSRPWTSGSPLRPVTVVFHGGAYLGGTASFDMPPYGYPTLNVSATANDLVLVYPNYRLGALGFLPGQAIRDAHQDDAHAALNPGLLDQQAALRWVHAHIDKFGGDPKNVSIFGQSAGGGSVIAQTIANGGATIPRLFQKALASSPFCVKTYKYNDPEAEALYENFVNLTGCPLRTDEGKSALDCLRRASLSTIMEASTAAGKLGMFPNLVWAPVIDGVFLKETLTKALVGKRLNADFVWGTFNSDEGVGFVDPLLENATGMPYNSTEAGFDAWLADFLPRFANNQLQAAKKLYPAVGETDTDWSWNTTFGRASFVYRDTALACPAFWLASAAPRKGWLGEYAAPPAHHVSSIWTNLKGGFALKDAVP